MIFKNINYKKMMGQLVIFLFIFAHLSFSQEEQKNSGQLENGIHYFLQKTDKPQSVTLFQLHVDVGSIDEKLDEAGYAHFLEHLAFKGGKRLKGSAFKDYLKSEGLQMGIHYNAETNYNFTTFSISFPRTADTKTQEYVLDFFADIIDGLEIKDSEIEAERKIIFEEKRLYDNDDHLFDFRVKNTLYQGKSPIGNDTSLMVANRKRLSRFYKSNYSTSKSTVVIVGSIDIDKTAQLLEDRMSSIKNNKNKTIEKTLYKDFQFDVSIIEGKNNELRIDIPIQQKKSLKEEVKQSLILRYLANTLDERIDSLYNDQFYNCYIRYYHFLSDVNLLSLNLTKVDNIETTIQSVYKELHRLALFGINEEAFNKWRNSQIDNIKTKHKNAYAILTDYKNYLKGYQLYYSQKEYDTLFKQELIQLQKEDFTPLIDVLREVKRTKFSLQKLDKEKRFDVKNVLQNNAIKDLSPLIYAEDISELDTTGYSSLSLKIDTLKEVKAVWHQTYEKINVDQLIYPNGLTVYIKPIHNDSNETRILGINSGGLSSFTDSLYTLMESTVAYMELGGIGSWDNTTLDNYLYDKNFALTQGISEYNRTLFGFTESDQMNEFIPYIYQKLAFSTVDTSEFNGVIRDEISSLNDTSDYNFPQDLVREKIKEMTNSFFPKRNHASTLEEYKNLDIYEMKKFYDQSYKFGNGWNYVIVGDFEKDEAISLANKYFGNLPSTTTPILNQPLFDPSSFPQELHFKVEEEQKYRNNTFLIYGNYNITVKQNLLLSIIKEYFNDKVLQSLREEKGYVYTPYVSLEKSLYPTPFYTFIVSYSCAPKNENKAQLVVNEILEKMLRGKLKDTQLEVYKNIVLTEIQETTENTNIFGWGNFLINRIGNGEQIQDIDQIADILKEINSDDVNIFINNSLYLDNLKLITN